MPENLADANIVIVSMASCCSIQGILPLPSLVTCLDSELYFIELECFVYNDFYYCRKEKRDLHRASRLHNSGIPGLKCSSSDYRCNTVPNI